MAVRNHQLYGTWHLMLRRCYDPQKKEYQYYGGRGIAVCDRWREDFWQFAIDMGVRPEGHTLDRIDNDGPYSPDNCRWATLAEQMANRRPYRRRPACRRGHLFSETNTLWRSDGTRACRECRRQRARARYHAARSNHPITRA